MTAPTAWRQWFSSRRQRRRTDRRNKYTPRLEELETRTTPSGGPGPSGPFLPTGTITTDTPTFTWSAFHGADHYDLWVNDQTTGQSQVLRNTNVTNNFLALGTAQALTPGDAYVWWVAAVDVSGNASWSNLQTFNITPLAAPTLTSPTGTLTTGTPTFSWTGVTGADHYDLWVNDQTTGQVVDLPNVAGTNVTLAAAQGLTPGDSYVWWAGAVSTNGKATFWSNPQTFTITPLAAPTLSGPTGTLSMATPTFAWGPVTGADHYDLWVNDQTTGQSQVLRVPSVTDVSYTVAAAQSLTPGDSYVWWAGAVSANGKATFWSNPQTFNIAALGVPALTGPTGTLSTNTPTFSWSSVAGADHYDLWVNDLTAGQSQVVRFPSLTDTSLTLTAAQALPLGHTYAWWAGAVSANGSATFWSSAQFFSIASPAPSTSGPTGVITTDTPTFSWGAMPWATHYDLWVNDRTTGQNQVVRMSNVPGAVVALPTTQALTPGNSYVWWAGSVGAAGQPTFWSSPQYFTVAPMTPPTPVNAGVATTAMPTFSWDAVVDAGHYDLWMNDQTTGKQVMHLPNVTATSLSLDVTHALTPDHNYTWGVGAVSNNGKATAWSNIQSFTFAQSPPSVTLTGPDFTTLRDTNRLSVQVGAVVGIVPVIHIDADLQGNGTFADKGDTDVATFPGYTGTNSFPLAGVTGLPEGTYQLRARVTDVVGHTGVSTPITIQVDPNAGIIGDYWLLSLARDFTNPGSFQGGNGSGTQTTTNNNGGGTTVQSPNPGGNTPGQGGQPGNYGGINSLAGYQQMVVKYYNKILRIDSQDRVLVSVRATLTKYVPDLEQALKQMGMDVLGVYNDQNMVQGYLPITAVNNLPNLPNFSTALAVLRPVVRAGQIPNEGNPVMKADVFSSATGATGQGVKVGILSTSVNQVGGGLKDSQAVGALPANIQVLADDPNTPTDEGRAMLEIVYDVAPSAALAYHTATVSPQDFAAGIGALQAAGAQVIADDVGYADSPFFNDGILSKAANAAIAAGSTYISAAGNVANQAFLTNWKGVNGTVGSNTGTFLDVGGGKILQTFTVVPNDLVSLAVQWDAAFLEGGSPLPNYQVKNEIDVYISDVTGKTIYATFNTNTLTTDEAFQFVNWTNNKTGSQFALSFELVKGPAPTHLQWINFGSSDPAAQGEGGPTVFGQPAAAGAIGAAAVPWWTPTVPESFTSLGGNLQFFFDANGNRLTTPEVRFKPDFAAPDGVDTTFFSQPAGSDPDGDNLNDFFGTSAAAPQVAGAVALLLSELGQMNCTATPQEIYQHLRTSALDIAAPGDDFLAGHGLIQVTPMPCPTGSGGLVLTGPDNNNHTSDTALDMGRFSGTGFEVNQSVAHHPLQPNSNWYGLTAAISGSLSVTVANIVTSHGGDLHLRVFRLDPGNVLTELGNSTLIGGYGTQATTVSVDAGQRYLIWVYGFNDEQGNYDLEYSL